MDRTLQADRLSILAGPKYQPPLTSEACFIIVSDVFIYNAVLDLLNKCNCRGLQENLLRSLGSFSRVVLAREEDPPDIH